jgi:hypothetical protein
MEQKIKTRINEYLSQYKNDIKKWIDTNNIQVNSENGESCKSKFLDYMFDYQSIELSKQDFQKRTRAKNNIPNYERCCALRLNGERCTRKKKNDEFCGTHIKGIPYGSIEEKQATTNLKVDIWIEEIKGINQWIDSNHNVYSTEDISQSVKQPRVISKWSKNEKGEYYIV